MQLLSMQYMRKGENYLNSYKQLAPQYLILLFFSKGWYLILYDFGVKMNFIK